MADILWITPAGGFSEKMRVYLRARLASQKISESQVVFIDLHAKARNFVEKVSARKFEINPNVSLYAYKYLNQCIEVFKPKVIVCNDEHSLWLFSKDQFSLNSARGSVFFYRDLPVVALDKITNVFTVNYAGWVLTNDLKKVKRWCEGKQQPQPKFTYEIVSTEKQLRVFRNEANIADAISIDCETKGGFITCSGYTILRGNRIHTYVIPFFDPFKESGCFWDTEEEEIFAWEVLREVHANSVVKILQNGTYDGVWYAICNVPLHNYIIDTGDMMHSIWLEAPKRLDFISSLFLDYCRFWKEEHKGSKEDSWGRTRESVEKYWRYNALDCYNTMLNAMRLLPMLTQIPWAFNNYNAFFRLSVGPCFSMALTGFKIDTDRHKQIIDDLSATVDVELAKLRIMTDDPDFNPSSSPEVASFLYDVIGAKQTRLQARKKNGRDLSRSVDKKILKLIKEQPNPLLGIFIDQLWAQKEPRNNISKYGSLRKLASNGRFYYSFSASGTETGRFSGSGHQTWVGTNPQNIPPEMREFLVADDDYVVVDIDYRASDDRFIAYEANDPVKIDLVESGKDPHAFHASFFFKVDYDWVIAGKKAQDPVIVHPITGIRSNTKRVVHGRNFMMQAETLYNTMGRESVVATALALGYENGATMSDKELIGVCRQLCDAYDNQKTGLYKRIRPWQEELITECVSNGNLLTSAGGVTRYFFGDPSRDNKIQRDMAAFKGQSGTASNINRALLTLFYSGIIDLNTVILLLQVHDSLTFLVHKDHLSKIKDIVAVMEAPITINGQQVVIPTDVSVGLTWSKDMLDWNESVTYEDIVAFEKEHFKSKYVPAKPLTLNQLATTELEF